MSPNCHRNVTLMSPNIYYRRDDLSTHCAHLSFCSSSFKRISKSHVMECVHVINKDQIEAGNGFTIALEFNKKPLGN